MTIKECLNSVQKQNIDKNILNDLMMKTETRTINRHGITFLGMHYRSEALLDLRETVFIRYSLFDLSKIYVYSTKGEFLCVARQVEKIHPMANHLGTVKDMEEFKQRIQKQKRQFNKAKKEFLKYYPTEDAEVLKIEGVNEEKMKSVQELSVVKPKRERKRRRAEGESDSDTRLTRAPKRQTPREQQINRPFFNSDYEKFEWLMSNGTTNQEDRKWLVNYMKSDE